MGVLTLIFVTPSGVLRRANRFSLYLVCGELWAL
jgi:hypothetical protein